MDRGTVRNMYFYFKNNFEKLVHPVGFIITIYSEMFSGFPQPLQIYAGIEFLA